MIAMTTSSSISVKPRRRMGVTPECEGMIKTSAPMANTFFKRREEQ